MKPTVFKPYRFRTKYCNKLYVGCMNVECTYAHHPRELECSEVEGMKEVRFIKPHDADPHSRAIVPRMSEVPELSFIVHFDEDEERKAPVMSLSEMDRVTHAWRLKKMSDAYWTRQWHIRKVHDMTRHHGEEDMAISPAATASSASEEDDEKDMDISPQVSPRTKNPSHDKTSHASK